MRQVKSASALQNERQQAPQFASSGPLRADPAPSRSAYRMQRLMLTPLFRLTLRVGVPFALALGGATLWFADEDRRAALQLTLSDMRASIEQRPEFIVKLMAIDGADPVLAETIRATAPVDFPQSSFDLDLDVMRTDIAALDAVERVSVRIRSGGVLQVDVTPRVPVVVWRTDAGLSLLDAGGVRVGPMETRAARPDLPLIAGRGADTHIGEALALVAASGPLHDRLRGLVRVGDRRWNVVLDRDQTILLPQIGAVAALERVIAMDQAVDMLARDIAAVDMRLPQRATVRMSDEALHEMWRIKTLTVGDQ